MIRHRGGVIIFDEIDGREATSHTMMGYNIAYVIHHNKEMISIYDIAKNGKVLLDRSIDEPLVVKGMIMEFDKFSDDDSLQFTNEFEEEGKE